MFYLPCLCISPSGEVERFPQYFSHHLQEGCDCTSLKSHSEPTRFYKEMRKKQTPFCGSDVFCNTTTCSPPALLFNTGATCRLRPPWARECGGPMGWQPGPSHPWPGGAAPAPGIGHLPGDRDGARLGQDVGLWVGPAQVRPMAGQGRAVGSWRQALPCCYWGRAASPASWNGVLPLGGMREPRVGWSGAVRHGGALRTLTLKNKKSRKQILHSFCFKDFPCFILHFPLSFLHDSKST